LQSLHVSFFPYSIFPGTLQRPAYRERYRNFFEKDGEAMVKVKTFAGPLKIFQAKKGTRRTRCCG
jgi:hypothetical protein